MTRKDDYFLILLLIHPSNASNSRSAALYCLNWPWTLRFWYIILLSNSRQITDSNKTTRRSKIPVFLFRRHQVLSTCCFQTVAKWSLIDMIHLPDESICLTDPLLQKGWDVQWLAPTLSTDYVGFMERIKHLSFPIPHHKHNAKPLSVLCVWDMAVRICKIL